MENATMKMWVVAIQNEIPLGITMSGGRCCIIIPVCLGHDSEGRYFLGHAGKYMGTEVEFLSVDDLTSATFGRSLCAAAEPPSAALTKNRVICIIADRNTTMLDLGRSAA